jgi:hypothetical protein
LKSKVKGKYNKKKHMCLVFKVGNVQRELQRTTEKQNEEKSEVLSTCVLPHLCWLNAEEEARHDERLHLPCFPNVGCKGMA